MSLFFAIYLSVSLGLLSSVCDVLTEDCVAPRGPSRGEEAGGASGGAEGGRVPPGPAGGPHPHRREAPRRRLPVRGAGGRR